jgi:hypothetical protein
VLSELLEHEKTNADVNAVDLTRSTALHYAAYYGISEVITKLLEAGADVRMKDADDLTAYDLVCAGMTSSHVTTAILLHPHYGSAPAVREGGMPEEDTPLPPASPVREHPLLRAVSNNLITQFQMAKTVVIEKADKKSLKGADSLSPGRVKDGRRQEAADKTMQRSASAPSVRLSNAEQAELAHKLSYTWKKEPVDPHSHTIPLPRAGAQIDAPMYELPFQALNSSFDVPAIVSKLPYPNGLMGAAEHKQTRSDKAVVAVISVEQCHDCAAHGWNLRHNEEQYTQQADDALMQCVCTLLNANDLPLTVFAFKHRAPKSRTGALEVVVSLLVPDSPEHRELLEKTYSKPARRPASASKPGPLSPARRQPLSTDYAGKPVFKNPSFTNGAVLPTPAPPLLYEADKQALHNRKRRTRHGKLWVHHVLHSKLATQSWPSMDNITHDLLKVVRAFVPSCAHSSRPMSAVASKAGSTDEDEAAMSRSQRALTIAKQRSPTFVLNGKHDTNVFYYNLWYERLFSEHAEPEPAPAAAPVPAPAPVPSSVPAPRPAAASSSVTPAPSRLGSRKPSLDNALDAHSVAGSAMGSPITTARRDSGATAECHSGRQLDSRHGSLELSKDGRELKPISEPVASAAAQSDAAKLLEMASHSVSPAKKRKGPPPCRPCFLGYLPRPEEDKEFHKAQKQKQKAMIAEYEDKVLEQFFVFDNV